MCGASTWSSPHWPRGKAQKPQAITQVAHYGTAYPGTQTWSPGVDTNPQGDKDLGREESIWKSIAKAHQLRIPVNTTLKRKVCSGATVPISNARLREPRSPEPSAPCTLDQTLYMVRKAPSRRAVLFLQGQARGVQCAARRASPIYGASRSSVEVAADHSQQLAEPPSDASFELAEQNSTMYEHLLGLDTCGRPVRALEGAGASVMGCGCLHSGATGRRLVWLAPRTARLETQVHEPRSPGSHPSFACLHAGALSRGQDQDLGSKSGVSSFWEMCHWASPEQLWDVREPTSADREGAAREILTADQS